MKKLQKGSRYEEYDEDGDGIVSDEELSHVKQIKETETALPHRHRREESGRRGLFAH